MWSYALSKGLLLLFSRQVLTEVNAGSKLGEFLSPSLLGAEISGVSHMLGGGFNMAKVLYQ